MLSVLPEVIEPETWTLAFHRTSPYWWVRLLAAGKYKHVSAFAWVPALDLWLVYEITLTGTRLCLLPNSDAALRRLGDLTADAGLMTMRRVNGDLWRSLAIGWLFAPFSCVSAIRHLVGVPGALPRPDDLWRDCLRHGGTPYGSTGAAIAVDQRGTACAAGSGEG